MKKKQTTNNRLPQVAVTWLIEGSSFYQSMEEEMIVNYKGILTLETIEALLIKVKKRMVELGLRTLFLKKVFSIMVEDLENIHKHCDHICTNDKNVAYHTEFSLCKTKTEIIMRSRNSVLSNKIPALREKIDSLNTIEGDHLKTLYKNKIITTTISEKGGAGLGLIGMKRTSGHNLLSSFTKLDEKYSMFELVTRISIL